MLTEYNFDCFDEETTLSLVFDLFVFELLAEEGQELGEFVNGLLIMALLVQFLSLLIEFFIIVHIYLLKFIIIEIGNIRARTDHM